MKKLIVIEDEYSKQDSLSSICEQWPEKLEIHTVTNERQALKILLEKKIDLLLCDLSSGYGFHIDHLANLSYKYPHIPCIALISEEQQLEEEVLGIGASYCVFTPIDPQELKQKVSILSREANTGIVRGLPVHSLLQMFEGDEKTCTLRVESKGRLGFVYMDKGEPVAAETADQLNEDAFYSIVTWDEAIIEILHYNRRRSNEIQQPLLALIIEAFRLKDERESLQEKQQADNKPRLQLQHVSTAGNRLSIQMGAKVKMEVDGVDSSLSLAGIMVGMLPNQFLLVTAPNPYEVMEKAIAKENKLVIKFLHMGRLCLFRTKILAEVKSPRHILFLEYPSVIHFHELRRAKRTTIFVPATLKHDSVRELTGVLVDLSSIGCLFLVKVRGNAPLPNFDIESPVELHCLLPGIAESQVLQGKVKNFKKTTAELNVGVQFVDLPGYLAEAIDNYVVSIESVAK